MKTIFCSFLLVFLFTNLCFSQLLSSDIERSTHLYTGGVSDNDGKNKSYNKSFTAADGFVISESGGSISSSGSYNNLESHNLIITSSKEIGELVVKRRVSKSWSRDVTNTYLKPSVTNNLKLSFTTNGRAILKGNASASLKLKLQLGNRHSGFIFKTLEYELRPKTGDHSKIEIYNKHGKIVSTIPNGGKFEFSYMDRSHRTFIGEREVIFTVSTLAETLPAEGQNSYAFLKTESGFDIIK